MTTFAGMSLATAGAALAAPCAGPGAPTTAETKCLTAVQIPGNPLRSFDISWVNPFLNQYYLGDVVNPVSNAFALRRTGFVGIVLNGTAVNNAKSGADGVTLGRQLGLWRSGHSTLRVFTVFTPPTFTNGAPGVTPTQSISTGGQFRVDEMALTTDGKLLLAANNAEDRPSPRFSPLTAMWGCSSGTHFTSVGDARGGTVRNRSYPLQQLRPDIDRTS